MNNYFKPQLKSLVEFCSIDNYIYFFNRPSVAIKLHDPVNFISTVCNALDGIKNISDLKEMLKSDFPQEINYLENLLTVLDNEFLLEDSTNSPSTEMTKYDIDRWSRNIEFFGAHCKASENKFDYQEKIKKAKVVILGLGGVGSNVLYNLVALGITNIKAVDCDNVELSNLNRQIIYNESDIGSFKANAARERILQFNEYLNLEFANKKISSTQDIEDLIHDQDIVIGAIDHPREEVIGWLNQACVNQRTTFLCGALDSQVAQFYSIIPGKTGCIECWKFSSGKSALLFQELIMHKNFKPSNSPNVAIMPLIAILSGLLSSEVLKIISEKFQPQSLGRLTSFDFISSLISHPESWEINPHCAVCQKD